MLWRDEEFHFFAGDGATTLWLSRLQSSKTTQKIIQFCSRVKGIGRKIFTAIYMSEFNIVYRIKIIGLPLKEFQDLEDNEIYAYFFFIGCFFHP